MDDRFGGCTTHGGSRFFYGFPDKFIKMSVQKLETNSLLRLYCASKWAQEVVQEFSARRLRSASETMGKYGWRGGRKERQYLVYKRDCAGRQYIKVQEKWKKLLERPPCPTRQELHPQPCPTEHLPSARPQMAPPIPLPPPSGVTGLNTSGILGFRPTRPFVPRRAQVVIKSPREIELDAAMKELRECVYLLDLWEELFMDKCECFLMDLRNELLQRPSRNPYFSW